jgi:hypothetical protein
MKNIIAFFRKIIELILKMLFDKKETSLITSDGNELITSDEKIFLIKEEK